MTSRESVHDAPIALRVLGPIEVAGEDGHPISLSPQGARLLALLTASDSPVDKSQIAEHVTETAPDASAVRTAVSRLRSSVGSLLLRTDAGYVLDVAPNDSDIGRFRELLRVATSAKSETRMAALRQALELWRGDPFGFARCRSTRSAAVSTIASASAVGAFAGFTTNSELRSAVQDLDRLAWTTVDLMKSADFRSPNPSCGLLLVHLAHHLLPQRAHEARQWANEFAAANDYSISAMARLIAEISLTFLDPASPGIDPLRTLGDDAPEGPWTNAIAANAAYISVVTGRSEQATSLLDIAMDNAIPGSMSDLNRLVGQVANTLARGQVSDAMTLLVDQIDDVPFGVPGRESTYLAVCAWARHLNGHPTRAERLIDHTIKRLPRDYLLTCHVKAIIDDWPASDFYELHLDQTRQNLAMWAEQNNMTALSPLSVGGSGQEVANGVGLRVADRQGGE